MARHHGFCGALGTNARLVSLSARTQALSGSQLEWTKRHEEFQETNESLLEEVLGAAGVDPTGVLQALIATPEPSAGVTPLPSHLLAPLRAFVDYVAFEQMMKEGLPSV